MNQAGLYWAAFILYSISVIGIGYYIWWKKRGQAANNAAFWSADKNLSGWSAGLSISASMMSISWSCVYGVQLFYWYGIGAAWLLILPWLITMAGFYWLAPLFRKLNAFSQPELLEKRFGQRSRQILAPPLIFVFIVWAGAEIYAAGITIAPFLEISVPMTLLLIAIVVALYSFTGGFEAVVSTDKIQFALVAFFITTMAFIGINALAGQGQLGNLFNATHMAPKAVSGTPWYLSPGIALIAMTFLAYLPGWLVETDVWIRLQAARNDAQARKGILITGLNSLVFVGIMPMLIGLATLLLYPPTAGEIPARLEDGSLIFTVLMQDYTPAWLSILLGIGLVAAAMSTVDTCSNVVALSTSYDLLEPWLKNKLSAAAFALLPRLVSVAAVFLAFVYALFTDSLWDIFYLSSGILTTTIFIPVLAVFRNQAKALSANLAAVFGFLGTFIFYFLESRDFLDGWEPQWLADTEVGYILLGLICSAAGFVLGQAISTSDNRF